MILLEEITLENELHGCNYHICRLFSIYCQYIYIYIDKMLINGVATIKSTINL